MITNKTSLLASTLIGKDKSQPLLANVHITADGDLVACNGRTVLVVEAVDPLRAEQIPFEGKGDELGGDITLPLDLVEKVLRGIPTDKQFDGLLELLHIKQGKSGGDIVITSHDGKGEKTIKGKSSTRDFVDYKGILKKLYFDAERESSFILDRKRLISTLQTMDKICGDAPCYIEVTSDNNLFIRSHSPTTGQNVMGVIAGVLGPWKDLGSFEKKFRGSSGVRKKKRARRKKRIAKV